MHVGTEGDGPATEAELAVHDERLERWRGDLRDETGDEVNAVDLNALLEDGARGLIAMLAPLAEMSEEDALALEEHDRLYGEAQAISADPDRRPAAFVTTAAVAEAIDLISGDRFPEGDLAIVRHCEQRCGEALFDATPEGMNDLSWGFGVGVLATLIASGQLSEQRGADL